MPTLGLFQMLPGVPDRLRCRNYTDNMELMQVFPNARTGS
jgi:hypothetical protein